MINEDTKDEKMLKLSIIFYLVHQNKEGAQVSSYYTCSISKRAYLQKLIQVCSSKLGEIFWILIDF